MKKMLAAAGAALILTLSPAAAAASAPSLTINGVPAGSAAMAAVWNDTTYVSLRAVSSSLDSSAQITWENGTAYVRTDSMLLSACPGDTYLTVNGERLSVPLGIKVSQERVLVPIRTLAQAFGAAVYWNPLTGEVALTSSTAEGGGESYSDDDLYWLSRIISAESQGEPLEGKIAVGNVVLNRVASPDFPDSIYGVIFDNRWGGQFTPVRNGTIYQDPTEESVLAARLCLEGANVVGDSLYFLAPALAQNFWTVQNRTYVATIGCHEFYL
ncbi:MAG: cell wall hydrolase [Oscillospiraceae bacterium]